ncbi:2-oxoisovalerate dehydrogenase E2 component (dihydrolipoyl transacylase) [Nocardioides zeae]|uniref:2-oxoisovalerate dehydrogenase E2 component (Dihydrolipoyl transacylase) n=1 Tax=Nocardioides zeae TaxID=1457234 RepID=A0ACC6IFT8_9ACTN|nr:dihydrolipoamide acetyltransferase family protein [Nocardioides zeae]MDR6209549.1 2-oxoisovalerate dehydrogenase E2 component (dihydrolipoyl transacylase) [Nocardioides zeae]
MSTPQQFLLPDVGEGLTEAEIVTWHVAVGDTVEVNQTLVDIETAKSVVELPSPFAGQVIALLVPEGQTVDVGTPIIEIGTPQAAPTEDEPQLLVGYGAREATTSRRRRGGAPPAAAAATTDGQKPRAKPPVRKLAQVLGVDLASLTPSGPDGIVVRTDVLAAAQQTGPPPAPAPTAVPEPTPAEPAPYGLETRIPVKGVRKQTAAAMVSSAFTAPHVTEFVTVDVTATLELRDRVLARRAFRDVRATPLAFVARAYLHALRRTPMATARWDEAAQEIVVPGQVNLGIAAATPRGLVVPNVKAADRMDLRDLAVAIDDLAQTARAGRTTPESMAHGTTTITNVGVFGVDTGTPILNPGETAILAVGAIRRTPWVVGEGADERIEPRSVLQLALSFDHRVLDGAEGSRVLADTAAILRDPTEAFL